MSNLAMSKSMISRCLSSLESPWNRPSGRSGMGRTDPDPGSQNLSASFSNLGAGKANEDIRSALSVSVPMLRTSRDRRRYRLLETTEARCVPNGGPSPPA